MRRVRDGRAIIWYPNGARVLAGAMLGCEGQAHLMIDATSPLVLGSGSPRRRDLLEQVGVPLRVVRPEVDEAVRGGELPADYLERVVRAKLSGAAALLEGAASAACPALLVADTVVVHDGAILGKPRDLEAAVRMVTTLAGRQHQVMTRFAIGVPSALSEAAHAETIVTKVHFRSLSERQIRRYAETGDGSDKAGAYGIQSLGAMLVRAVEGSYSNVVGLPLEAVIEALEALGAIDTLPVAGVQVAP